MRKIINDFLYSKRHIHMMSYSHIRFMIIIRFVSSSIRRSCLGAEGWYDMQRVYNGSICKYSNVIIKMTISSSFTLCILIIEDDCFTLAVYDEDVRHMCLYLMINNKSFCVSLLL